jgi:hypothetical protein
MKRLSALAAALIALATAAPAYADGGDQSAQGSVGTVQVGDVSPAVSVGSVQTNAPVTIAGSGGGSSTQTSGGSTATTTDTSDGGSQSAQGSVGTVQVGDVSPAVSVGSVQTNAPITVGGDDPASCEPACGGPGVDLTNVIDAVSGCATLCSPPVVAGPQGPGCSSTCSDAGNTPAPDRGGSDGSCSSGCEPPPGGTNGTGGASQDGPEDGAGGKQLPLDADVTLATLIGLVAAPCTPLHLEALLSGALEGTAVPGLRARARAMLAGAVGVGDARLRAAADLAADAAIALSKSLGAGAALVGAAEASVGALPCEPAAIAAQADATVDADVATTLATADAAADAIADVTAEVGGTAAAADAKAHAALGATLDVATSTSAELASAVTPTAGIDVAGHGATAGVARGGVEASAVVDAAALGDVTPEGCA